jgi:hypothetical protein
VISKAIAPHHSNKIHVRKCIKVINFNCGAKSKYKHGDSPHIIKVSSSSTKIVEILVFLIQFMFTHRHSIVEFVTCNIQHDVVCMLPWSCKFMVWWIKNINFLLMGQDQKIWEFIMRKSFPSQLVYLVVI